MLVLIHVSIALSSIAYAAYAAFEPSVRSLYITYTLIAATLLTGLSLIFMNPAHLPQACSMGLSYMVIMLASIAFIRRRIAKLVPVLGK